MKPNKPSLETSIQHDQDFVEGKIFDSIQKVSASTIHQAVLSVYDQQIQDNYNVVNLVPTPDGRHFYVEFKHK